MGISLDDLMRLTIHQFECARDAWIEEREDSERSRWERTRTLAAITVQPHIRRRITPRALLPFPWDHGHTGSDVEKGEDKVRLEQLIRRMDKVRKDGRHAGGKQ